MCWKEIASLVLTDPNKLAVCKKSEKSGHFQHTTVFYAPSVSLVFPKGFREIVRNQPSHSWAALQYGTAATQLVLESGCGKTMWEMLRMSGKPLTEQTHSRGWGYLPWEDRGGWFRYVHYKFIRNWSCKQFTQTQATTRLNKLHFNWFCALTIWISQINFRDVI